MKKIFFIPLLFILASSIGQTKITLNSHSLSVNDTALMLAFAHNKVDTVYRTIGKDSIQFKINGRYHAILDSAGGTDSAAYHSVTQVNDSTYTLNRPNGIKDTIRFAQGPQAVTSVSATLPIVSSGGYSPTISSHKVSATDSGYAVPNQIIGTIGDSENGGGTVISTGSKGFVTIPYNCTITNWYISANISGTIQFDVKRSGTSIIGAGNKPALSSALSANAAVSSWTSTTVTAGDILEWVVDASPAPASLTQCAVVLKVIKNTLIVLMFPASFFKRKRNAA